MFGRCTVILKFQVITISHNTKRNHKWYGGIDECLLQNKDGTSEDAGSRQDGNFSQI